jgi:glucose-1-phosphate cytidylyltransferase
MKMYSHYGFNDFVICLGYKGYVIKEYFMNYYLHNSDIAIDLADNRMEVLDSKSDNFKVTLVDTGLDTKTAGRLQRVQQYIGDDDFMLTYGDGVSDVNFTELVAFHKAHNKTATVTGIQLDSRFGGMELGENDGVTSFKEKAKSDGKWINGGFFVLKPSIFDYLKGDQSQVMWEETPLEKLAADNELMAFRHRGFWKCMDALRDKIELEELWRNNKAKWKLW